jgi:hypothetical protein
MSAPQFLAAGPVVSDSRKLTVAWPAGHRARDLGLLIVETGAGDDTVTLTGWTHVVGSPLVDVSGGSGSKFQLLWKQAVTDSEPQVSIPDGGDHGLACIAVFRGGPLGGLPFSAVATATKTSASTLATLPSVGVSVPNTLVLLLCSRPNDNNSTSVYGEPVNGSLTQLAKRLEGGSSQGNGGGFALFTGLMAAPGSVPATTVSQTVSTTNACFSLALPPMRRFARTS